MSVQARGSGKSRRHVVRWREGGRQHSRTFLLAGDADAFDLERKRRRQLGPIAGSVLRSRVTLAVFVETDWWPRHAVPNLAESTRRRYLEVWGTHILPRLGEYELQVFTPMLVDEFRGQLEHAGVSPQSQRKALMLLQGIFRRAVVRGLLSANPAQPVDKPRPRTQRRPEPLSPATIERIRSFMGPRDATLVSVLAYAGLRPAEATSLRWRQVREGVVHVHASKTDRPRSVRLLAPLAQDLAEWRLLSGRPPESALVFPGPHGGEWNREAWGNWRNRVWIGEKKKDPRTGKRTGPRKDGAAIRAGVTGDMRPYRLRGSFVSLLLAEGRALPWVAGQAGHSVGTLASHYAGVLAELENAPRIDAEQAIGEAREGLRERRTG